MILEQLITKYLDSDLSNEEDSELREMLASDPLSKQMFDESALMHIALRFNTDQPVVSPELRNSVLSHIDDVIAADQATSIPLSAPTDARSSRSANSLTSLLAYAVVFMLFCLPTSDPVKQIFAVNAYHSSETSGRQSEVMHANATTNSRNAVRHSTAEVISMSAQQPMQAVKALEPTTSDGLMADTTNFSVIVPTTTTAAGSLASFRSMLNASSANFGTSSESHRAPLQTMNMEEEKSEVLMGTTYARGFGAVSGVSDLTQIAQSVAYSVSKDGYIGIEVGATNYTMSRNTVIRMSAPGTVSQTRVQSDKSKLGDVSDPPIGYTNVASNQVSHERVIWGAAFVDKTLANLSRLELKGRAAVGAGEDGLMTYGRASASVKLMPSVSFTIGAEARLMPFRVGPELTASSSSTLYGFTLNAISGIHIQF